MASYVPFALCEPMRRIAFRLLRRTLPALVALGMLVALAAFVAPGAHIPSAPGVKFPASTPAAADVAAPTIHGASAPDFVRTPSTLAEPRFDLRLPFVAGTAVTLAQPGDRGERTSGGRSGGTRATRIGTSVTHHQAPLCLRHTDASRTAPAHALAVARTGSIALRTTPPPHSAL